MPILPTISTLFIFISAVLVVIGWILVSKKKYYAHKRTMIAAAISALLFFIIYISRTIFVGNTSFGGPDDLKIYYTTFLLFHITLATISAFFGIVTLRLALKRNITKHRKLGPITSVIWLIACITGIMVYFLLYIFFDGGETTSMIRAILGY